MTVRGFTLGGRSRSEGLIKPAVATDGGVKMIHEVTIMVIEGGPIFGAFIGRCTCGWVADTYESGYIYGLPLELLNYRIAEHQAEVSLSVKIE